jgi:predicted deacetylase
MSSERRTLAVALHDIEPATFERCALIRDWLEDHGVNQVTLLVIPARDLHPLAERSPEMVSWLIERERSGDAIAQHGFQHLRSLRGRGRTGGPYQSLRTLRADRETEFVGLDAQETQRAVDAGRRVLKLAGIEPRGFVAPGYAYTPALRRTLGERFHWWAALLGLHRAPPATPPYVAVNQRDSSALNASILRAPVLDASILDAPVLDAPVLDASVLDASALGGSALDAAAQDVPARGKRVGRRDLLGPPIALSSAGRLRRALSPALLRAGALVSGTTLRLDLHPADLDHPSHMLALEWVLKRSSSTRQAVTYEQLAFAATY